MERRLLFKRILILVAVVIIGFGAVKLISSYSGTGKVQDTAGTGKAVQDITLAGEVKEFNVKAFRFGYTPDEITVNKGDKVKITIDNADTLHGIRIPDLGIRGNDVLEFVAEKQGEFAWYCNNMCGGGHMQMSGKLVVK